ncbi:hypothetical protein CJEDD_04090 [Corynebacterium jeddahense]|uniref:PPE family protein n=1 Tax=Corynebacterium jeddahense TaxID=1414719 RepID=A0ABY7ULL0_9CORY|nr:hypothetical protein CJEDD_04090 [Corynebacterium jeddahense]
MGVLIDTEQIESSIKQLRRVASRLSQATRSEYQGSLTSFSTVSGLDEAGERLNPISAERAPEATQALVLYLMAAADRLDAALSNTRCADDSFAGFVSSFGGALSDRGAMAAPGLAFTAHAIRTADPKTNEFDNSAAIAGSEGSLNSVNLKLDSTDTGLALAASDFWTANAKLINTAVEDLNEVHHLLSSSAETLWVSEAMKKITQIQNAGHEYAANSTSLATHTSMLADAADAESSIARAAMAAYTAAETPEEKQAIEHSYLSSFPGRMTGNLAPTIPTFNRLLPEPSAMPAEPYNIGSMPKPVAPQFEPAPLPTPLQEAFTRQGYGDLANTHTASEIVQQFGRPTGTSIDGVPSSAARTHAASAVMAPPNPAAAGAFAPTGPSVAGTPGVGHAFAGGGLTPAAVGQYGSQRGGVGTAGAGSAAPGLAGTGPRSGAGGIGADVGSGAGNRSLGGNTLGGNAGRGPGNGGAAARGGAAGFGPRAGVVPGLGGAPGGAGSLGHGAGAHAVRPGFGTGAGTGPGLGSGAAAGAGMHAARPGFGNAGFAPGTGSGAGFGAGASGGAGASAGASGGAGNGMGAGHGAGPAAGTGANATGTSTSAPGGSSAAHYGTASSSNGSQGARGSVVGGGHMGAAGAGQNRRQDRGAAKVKTVTSAVERDGNLRALLGEAPLLLPGIIGHNVRD